METQSSSHFDHWILSSEKLENMRTHAEIYAKSEVQPTVRCLVSVPLTALEIESETLNSIAILYTHFLKFMAVSCGYLSNQQEGMILRLRWRTTATAMELFKRFFASNSMTLYDPRITMLGCLYLAGKVEHYYIKAVDLLKIYDKCSEQDILDSEIVVLQGVGYELKIYHPINANHTLIADYKRSRGNQEAASTEQLAMRSWEQQSAAYLQALQLTDVTLIVNPVSLAISSLLATEPAELSMRFSEYLNNKFGERAAKVFNSQHEYIQSKYYTQTQLPINEVALKNAMSRLKKEKRWSTDRGERKRPRESENQSDIT